MTSHDLYHSRVVPLCPVNSGATAPLKSVVATDTTEEAVKLHDSEKLSAESRANDIHRRGICCDSGDKKLSLSNNDEAPSDEVSAPLDLSDALRVLTSRRESGACSVDTQHRGGRNWKWILSWRGCERVGGAELLLLLLKPGRAEHARPPYCHWGRARSLLPNQQKGTLKLYF